MKKTDNDKIWLKINFRKKMLNDFALKSPNVLDVFAGKNKIWEKIDHGRYFGIEKEKNKGKNLHADNLKVLPSLDLSGFDVVDFDAYGCPIDQMKAFLKNGTFRRGVIFFTDIVVGMGAVNKDFELDGSFPSVIYKEVQQSLFLSFVFNEFGPKNIFYYERLVGSPIKTYGCFFYENTNLSKN